MAKQWREAFCPICGLSHGLLNKTMPGRRDQVLERYSFWDKTEEYTGDKPFGVVKESSGRGTMQLVGYYDIDEDVEGFFIQIKARLCNVIAEWVEKGWITPEEIQQCIAGVIPGLAVEPAVETSIAPFTPAAKEAKPAKKKKAKPLPAAKPTPAEMGVEVQEVISTEVAVKVDDGVWMKQISELTDGTTEVSAFFEPKKPREREEGEYYSQIYPDYNKAVLTYDKLTTLKAIQTRLVGE